MRLTLRLPRSRPTLPAPGEPVRNSGDGSSVRVILAVRRDWPDGTHEFVGPADTLTDAARLWNTQHRSWRCSPCRPKLSVVPISAHDFWLHARHRPWCAAPDCPSVTRAVAP